MAELEKQLKDYRLTTAQIVYHLPDHQSVLQEFIWQEYDIAPEYPTLRVFLDFWVEKIEGKLHSVYVAKQELITPGDYRFAEWQGTVQ
ncbi:MAG: usg protein [Alphaproteobacteria bacterium]